MVDDLDKTYDRLERWLRRRNVVPVLGAGVNLCGRPPGVGFSRGKYLPSGRELASFLAEYAHFPNPDERDLARVAQYVATVEGAGELYNELHEVFDADYPPTDLHRLLARLSRCIRKGGNARDSMLLLTTNYDNGLERAFEEAGEPYDLLTYIAEGPDQGLFRHVRADGTVHLIRKPNEYEEIDLVDRAVIAKIHGAVDRIDNADSYVITEDHYIDYISRANVSGLFPVMLASKLPRSHFLFLGYSLRDWNFRVMLHRLWVEQAGRDFKSLAIDAHPDPADRRVWAERGVEILSERLENFVGAMDRRFPVHDAVA